MLTLDHEPLTCPKTNYLIIPRHYFHTHNDSHYSLSITDRMSLVIHHHHRLLTPCRDESIPPLLRPITGPFNSPPSSPLSATTMTSVMTLARRGCRISGAGGIMAPITHLSVGRDFRSSKGTLSAIGKDNPGSLS